MTRETAIRFLSLCLTLSVSSQLIIPAAVGLLYAMLLSVSVLLSRYLLLFLLRHVATGCCCTTNEIEHGMHANTVLASIVDLHAVVGAELHSVCAVIYA